MLIFYNNLLIPVANISSCSKIREGDYTGFTYPLAMKKRVLLQAPF